ncbi:MAG: domain S-box protein [Pseudomonas sp.]|nr:domain S-box protein [Pseudomonas sp.]
MSLQIPRIGLLNGPENRPSVLIWGACFVLITLVISLSLWNLYRNLQDRRNTVAYSTQVLASSVAGYAGSIMGQHQLLNSDMAMPLTAIEDYLDKLGYKPGIAVALIDAQGRVLLQKGKMPSPEFLVGEDGLTLLKAGASQDVFLARKTVPQSSMHVVVARWPEEYLSSWYQQRLFVSVEIVLKCLALLGTAAGLASACLRIIRKERRYRQLFQSINDGVLILGQSGVLEANVRAARLFGVASAQDLKSIQFSDLCMPRQQELGEDPRWVERLLLEVESGTEVFKTLKFRRLDQAGEFVCEVRLSSIQLGRSIYLLACLHDITGRLRAENELQISQQKLLEAQLIAGLGVWSWDADADHAMWTAGCARIFGLPAVGGKFSRADFNSSLSLDERAYAERAFGRALRGERLDIELEIRRPDGHLRNVLICGELRQHEGSQQLLGAMLDITAQKRVERRLNEGIRHYRELVEMLPDGLLIFRNYRVIFANVAAARLFGADSLDRFIGLGIFELVDASYREQLLDDLSAVLRPDYIPVFLPRRYKHLNGTDLEVDMAAQSLLMDGELCIQVVLRDVSEHHRMQRDLELANVRLQRLSGQIIEVQEAERRHLSRELHDDVGQLLTFIKISAAGIQRQLDGAIELRQAALVRIADEALSKIRNLSRMLRPVQLESLGLVAAMVWQVENYLPDMPEGVQCRLDCDELLPRPDPSVEIALFRIFQEALCNVLKHSSAAQVDVKLAHGNQVAHLTISDDGCGFDYASTLLEGQGIGLLSMAERAKLLGGEFLLRSSPGAGTQVCVSIPYNNDMA